MKTFLLCAALLGAGLAQAADDIEIGRAHV